MWSTFATITLLFRRSFEDPRLMYNDNGSTSFCKPFVCLWVTSGLIVQTSGYGDGPVRCALHLCAAISATEHFNRNKLFWTLQWQFRYWMQAVTHKSLFWFQLLLTCLLKAERYRASKRIIWLCAWAPLGFYLSQMRILGTFCGPNLPLLTYLSPNMVTNSCKMRQVTIF